MNSRLALAAQCDIVSNKQKNKKTTKKELSSLPISKGKLQENKSDFKHTKKQLKCVFWDEALQWGTSLGMHRALGSILQTATDTNEPSPGVWKWE